MTTWFRVDLAWRRHAAARKASPIAASHHGGTCRDGLRTERQEHPPWVAGAASAELEPPPSGALPPALPPPAAWQVLRPGSAANGTPDALSIQGR
ncbi:MAG: hypothetical protein JRI23_05840 [Deltaproteobacteria bacterium]|nr:hypothetical protein [Deltaproteobacteria bacterium]MBW2531084.1 hypothetical protein [Deltaproteobacteria bacterium]